MSTSFRRGARLGALGAAGALVAGAFMAAPAVADDQSAELESLDAAVDILSADAEVQGVTQAADGSYNVYALEGDVESVEAIAEEYPGSEFTIKTLKTPLSNTASNEVVGGAGIVLSDNAQFQGEVGLCSVGFSAWSPEGEPAMITAGHCTGDGALSNVALSEPSHDDAVGDGDVGLLAPLGDLVFDQFGGAGNSATEAAEGGETDIAVVDVTNPELEMLPEVTDWTTGAENDLAASTTPITSVGSAELGPMARSGRTTGHHDGQVVELHGYMRVEDRWVYGFGSIVPTIPGDSGGTVYQGTKAVGVVSGGGELSTGETFMWATDLQHGLDVINSNVGDYTVMLDLTEPTLDDASVWVNGSASVSAPGASSLNYAIFDGDEIVAEDTASVSNGTAGLPTGDLAPGTYDVALQSTQGFNESDVVEATLEVKLGAPHISTPADGAWISERVYTVSGTGVPGATIELAGAATGTVDVDADGNWQGSIDNVDGYGDYTITASQTFRGVTAQNTATTSFKVRPAAVEILTPADGSTFAVDEAPASVVGASEHDGAQVSVEITGGNVEELQSTESFATLGDTTVEAGSWMVDVPAGLEPGEYTVTARQTVDGYLGLPAEVTFTIEGAGAPDDGGEGGTPGDDDELVATGVEGASVLPLAGGAVLLLLVGATLLVIRARRSAARS